MKEQLIKGRVFLIPNPTSRLRDYSPETQKSFKTFLTSALGREIDGGERIFQVWFSDQEPYYPGTTQVKPGFSDNWSSHGCPQAGVDMDGIRHDKCRGVLPEKEVFALKEGETLVMTINGHKAEVIAQQVGSRYEWAGPNWEDAAAYIRY